MRNVVLFLIFAFTITVAIVIGSIKTPEKKAAEPLSDVPSIGSVQVLNGCGVDGLAWAVAQKLRENGFDVKNDGIGNAPTFNYDKTMVVSRTKDMRIARQIGDVLEVSSNQVILLRNNDERFDVTVFVGSDAEELSQ